MKVSGFLLVALALTALYLFRAGQFSRALPVQQPAKPAGTPTPPTTMQRAGAVAP